MNRILAISALAFALVAGAFAQVVPTQLLNSTNDGAGTDVESLLAAAGAGVDISADQTGDRLFSAFGSPVTLNYLFSAAGLAGQHKLGIAKLGSPGTIDWVLGDIGGSQVTSWTGTVDDIFALVLSSPGGQFSSVPSANTDSPVPASADLSLVGFDRRNHVAVFNQGADTFLAWEDLFEVTPVVDGGLLDYNDYGVKMSGANPVPEPGTLIVLGAAAALLASRRRRSA